MRDCGYHRGEYEQNCHKNGRNQKQEQRILLCRILRLRRVALRQISYPPQCDKKGHSSEKLLCPFFAAPLRVLAAA